LRQTVIGAEFPGEKDLEARKAQFQLQRRYGAHLAVTVAQGAHRKRHAGGRFGPRYAQRAVVQAAARLGKARQVSYPDAVVAAYGLVLEHRSESRFRRQFFAARFKTVVVGPGDRAGKQDQEGKEGFHAAGQVQATGAFCIGNVKWR
jgi:hypothetical protein